MPYYDFTCDQCKRTFTRRESFEEHDRRTRRTCPDCGSRRTRRLIPVARVHTSKKS
jgi:putative FmdB family regulatory protein